MFIPVSGDNLAHRLIQLVLGLVMFGTGIGLMLQSDLGLPPWDVLHQGLAKQFGLSVGMWSIIVSLAVLMAWFPLREGFGIGTLLNAVVIGVMIDLTAAVVPAAGATFGAALMLGVGIVMIGWGSGLYRGESGAGATRRGDDGHFSSGSLDPCHKMGHGGGRPGGGMAARWNRWNRHGCLRRVDGPAGPLLPSPLDHRRRPAEDAWNHPAR